MRKVLGLATLVLALTAAPARGDERVDAMVAALREDPVLVSTALSRSVPPADAARLRRLVAAARVPAYVVVAPSFSGQTGLETLDELPDLLHDRLGRDGLYLVVDRQSFARAQAFGVEPRFELRDLFFAVDDDRPDARPGEAAAYALQLALTGRRAPVAERPEPEEAEDVAALPVALAGLGGAAGGFVVGGLPWLRDRRRQRAELRGRIRRPAPIRAAEARAAAREELEALAGALAGAADPPVAAFDAYAAASKALDDERRPVDLVAALTLARRGRALLNGDRHGPCFFDPRHKPAKASTRWRLGDRQVDIPACRPCANALRRGGTPVALEDRGRPYYEQDTLWARTGFGALDDELPARVLRGEARR